MASAKPAYHHGNLREALIESALAVITEDGPAAITIREVARRAGVSHAAPYRHFNDRDELLLAVVEQGFERLDDAMAAARDSQGDDELANFAASGEAYFDFALDNPTYYRVMFSGDLLSRSGHESLSYTTTSFFRQIIADVKRLQALGIVRDGDPTLLGIHIVSTVHGYVSLVNDGRISHLVDGHYSQRSVRDFVMEAVILGIGAIPPIPSEETPS
ncbi:MAG: TetR/AcrR family transcriptional regulator [Pseudomonadota bacterium]